MIAPDIAIRDVLIGYRTRPRSASRFNHRSGGGSIHHYLATLHTRLYSPPAAAGPLPTDLDELRLTALTGADDQQEAVLAHLATQLPRTTQLLQRPLRDSALPVHTRAWLRDADGAIRQLADQISRVSPAFALPHVPPVPPAPAPTLPGADPTPGDITRVLADFVSPDIAPDDVVISFRPHPRTGGRFTAREATATAFGSLLHARLHGLEAASAVSPGPRDELSRSPHVAVGQQAADLARLSGQLHSAGDILAWARHWSHWRRLPRDVHARLGSATTAVRELAEGISQIAAAPRAALAATPAFAPPAAPSPAPARR
ncbi:hypothetical protein [Streptomyces sp. MNP-20]|uniref:hypothetical protein n=1 Tax=Streptomyces sp. MNP-20 TaxID=2721165 RepID=UPI0015525926|nr:hypothetical protein [Streptomyces sp. MNP-20]